MDNLKKNHSSDKQAPTAKEYFQMGEVLGYFFRKKDPSRPSNISLKMMHGVNKISIIMFLAGMTFFIIKKLFF